MATTCQRVKLTKAVLSESQPLEVAGKKRQLLLYDATQPGFGVVVGASKKSFFVERTVNGRRVRKTFARFGEMTVDDARSHAVTLLGKMAKGHDLVKEARAARAKGVTLQQAWELYQSTCETKDRSPTTVKGYESIINTYLKDWLNKPLAEITRADVRKKHQKIADDVARGRYATVTTHKGNKYKKHRTPEHGKYTANATLRLFRAIYNRAWREYEELPPNPCVNVDWFKESRRKTVIPSDKLHLWHAGVTAMDNPVRRDALLLLLFTGLRRTTAVEIRREHINLTDKTLLIPNPKGGAQRAFTIPLSDFLVDLIERRLAENDVLFPNSSWLFPAQTNGGHLIELKARTPVPFTPHDLRRTFITTAESLSISPYAIKLLVNHALPGGDVTAGYVQHETERLREPMQQITDRLHSLCLPPKDGGKVVPMRKRVAKAER